MHRTIAFAALVTGVLALLGLLSACDQPTTKVQPAVPVKTWFVSAPTGNDSNMGSATAPFRTISHALGMVSTGDAVQVLPGTYDALTNGENFPLIIPKGVSLLGNEPGKGVGAPPTFISGAGIVNTPSAWTAAIAPGFQSTVAGFEITSTGTFAVYLAVNQVTLRNNTVSGSTGMGIYSINSSNHTIAGNTVQGNSSVGLVFVGSTSNTKIENNTFIGNNYGVELDVPGADLGGGPTGSVGGNRLYCNTLNDLWTNVGTGNSISARNNGWDHVPPTLGSGGGLDIYDLAGIVNSTGSFVVPGFCP